MQQAKCELAQRNVVFDIIESSIYETEPWGIQNANAFLNQVIIGNTNYSPFDLLEHCQKIESDFGRIRTEKKYSERTVDIDILLFEDFILNSELLTIPHKLLLERKFNLLPLNEIAPNMWIPIANCIVSEALVNCKDESFVRKVTTGKE